MIDIINEFKKVSSSRKHSITGSFGVKDAFIYYKHNRPKGKEYIVKDSIYRHIIREVNKELTDQLLLLGELKFPLDIGSLKVYKTELKPTIKNGKLYYKAPIDWNKTLQLWATDNSSRISKTLVKVNPGSLYSIKYKNKYCKFKNKEYFSLKISRTLKNKLKNKIRSKEDIPYYTTLKKL